MGQMMLVMNDNPQLCNKCPCMKILDGDSYCTKDMENFRKIEEGGQYSDISKPHWCPLISMPKKKMGLSPEQEEYVNGWNQALDAIGFKDSEDEQ